MTGTTISPGIQIIDGRALTTSQAIAEHFGKQHKNVIQKIHVLECSPEFNRLNFQPVEYTDTKGERRPAYQITRDGFAFLAMGFTGSKAAKFKEAYINAFNEMERQLLDTASRVANENPLRDFCQLLAIRGEPSGVLVGHLYSSYLEWMEAKGDTQPLTLTRFGLEMPKVVRELGAEYMRTRTRNGVRSNVELLPGLHALPLSQVVPVDLRNIQLAGEVVEFMRESLGLEDEKAKEVIRALNKMIN